MLHVQTGQILPLIYDLQCHSKNKQMHHRNLKATRNYTQFIQKSGNKLALHLTVIWMFED